MDRGKAMSHHQWMLFFAMGGYAHYVWSAYGIVAILLLGGVIKELWCWQKLLKKIKQEYVKSP